MRKATFAVLAALLLSAQSPISSFPPGTFSNQAARAPAPAPPPSGQVTPVLGWAGASAWSNTAVNYGALYSTQQVAPTATPNVRSTAIPISGTFSNLQVRFPTATGAGLTYDIALMVNGSASALTCQITNAALTCADTSNTVSISAGDLVEWRVTPTGTPASNTVTQISVDFTASSSESFIVARSADNVSTTAVRYAGFTPRNLGTTEVSVSSIVSAAGTIDHLYANASVSPGSSPRAYTMVLYKNGSATSLTCAVNGPATTCNDLTNSVAVVGGDLISVEITPSATAPAQVSMSSSFRFTPTTAKQSLLFSQNTAGVPNGGLTTYGHLAGGFNNGGTESSNYNLATGTFTLKNLYVGIDVVPGGATSRTINVRKGTGTQSNSGITCTIGAAALTCNDTSNTYTTALSEFLDVQHVPVATAAAVNYFKVGMTVQTP